MQSGPAKLHHFLLLSAAIHAAVLWEGAASPRQQFASITLLQATIATPVPAAASITHDALVADRPVRVPMTPQPMMAKGRKSSEDPAVDRQTVPATIPEPGVASVSSTQEGIGRETPEAAAVAMSPTEGVSADGLRRYRLALAREARRFKRYPPLARERGWEGTVEVVAIFGDALSPRVALEKSSDHAVLDQQAMAMITQAVQAAELPDSLRGRHFRLVIPVRYGLDE